MAISQEQVDAWFEANPNATADDVAAAVQSIGGLEANQGLAGMIANRYSIAEPEVTNYYNAYTAPETPKPPDDSVKNDQKITSVAEGPIVDIFRPPTLDNILTSTPTTQAELLTTLAAPADNITTTGYTKSATAPTSNGVSNVIEGDDIETQIAQLPEEYAHWSRSADQRTMELIRKSDGAVLDRRAVGDFSDLDLAKIGLSFIPGAGQILAGLNVVDAARRGDLLQAAIGATGILPGMQNVNTALRVGQAIDNNNPFGAVTALAGNTDLQKLVGFDATNIGGFTSKDLIAGANLAKAAGDNNYAGVLVNLGTLTGSSDTALAGRALSLYNRLQRGDTSALNEAVNLSNSVVSGATTGTSGSTTVGNFEDNEVTRLRGLGLTNPQIQDYFNNLDNLTGAFEDADLLNTTGTTGTDTTTGDTTGVTNTAGTTALTSLSDNDLNDLIDTLTVTGSNTDSGLSNADILNLITGGTGNDGIETLTVTGGGGNDTITGVDTLTGGGGNDDTLTVVGDRPCAAGFHRDEVTGLCVPDADDTLSCPEGYEPNEAGTACIPVIEIKDKKCDPGYTYDEDLQKCVPIETVTITDKKCDPGFVYDEDLQQCVAVDDDKCAEGFHRDAATGLCVSDVEECAAGYHKDASGACVPDTEECAEGFHRDDVTGLCVPNTETTLECPEGYEPNEAGTACIPKITIVDKKCGPGYVYDEDLKKCVPVGTDECAPGFHKENGLCVPDDDGECKAGYEKVNGVCVPVCKEGYIRNLATGVCEKVEDKGCPPGQVKNAEGKCVPIIKTEECKPGYEKVNGVCVPVCQPGYQRVNGVCKKIATDLVPTPTTSPMSAEGEKTDPIYAGAMDDFDLFATLQELLKEDSDKTDKKKDSKKSKEKTKMATGGHLDDLLAEQMTVDDLLKLLR